MPAARLVGFFFLLLVAGCAGMERPSKSQVPPRQEPATEPAKAGPVPREAPRDETPAAGSSVKKPVEQSEKKTAAPSARKNEAAASLDLKGLETRLKETKALGVFTKLTLKNQVDDLLEQFRAYYQGRAKTTLTELRQPYDRLLLKVLTLLQDGDPALAREIVSSRDAIWNILADPAKFATL